MNRKFVDIKGLTFDDVLLVPAYSKILPNEVDLTTKLTTNIKLKIPVMAAAMDTVSQAKMAIAMAQQGGIAIIHKNMSIQEQAQEIKKVKRSESGMIEKPFTLKKENKIHEAMELAKEKGISGLPIVNENMELEGILTNRDIRYASKPQEKIKDFMTPKNKLITARKNINMEEAKSLMHKHKIEKLPVVNKEFKLIGLITLRDIIKTATYPNAAKDNHGRLIVGAAVGTSVDTIERVSALVNEKVDVIIIDTSHGHSQKVLNTVKQVRKNFPDIQLIAGNIATGEAAKALINLGVNAIKVGIGPGSICTTRMVTGAGMPQISAIMEVAKESNGKIPVIADGGIKYSGEITKALAAGADTIMLGSLLAGTDESPGERIIYQGRTYKTYRGMGSLGAMKEGSKDRYFQEDEYSDSKLVPEGIEGRVPYRGSIKDIIPMMLGGLRAGMGLTGCKTVEELKTKAKFIQISNASLRESHVHDVVMTKEAPNYRTD